jgi:hypothetical protein
MPASLNHSNSHTPLVILFSLLPFSLFSLNGIQSYYINGSPTPEWPTCQPSKFTEEGEKQKAIGKGVAQRALASALQVWYILIDAESHLIPPQLLILKE